MTSSVTPETVRTNEKKLAVRTRCPADDPISCVRSSSSTYRLTAVACSVRFWVRR
jgi:hypothetical protein